MSRKWSLRILLCWSLWAAPPALAQNDGQADLDKATQRKVTAENLEDLNEVIDRVDTALEKGLDEDNTEFAEQLLVSALIQRGSLFAANIQAQEPQRGLRTIQLRQFALSDLQRAVEIDSNAWEAYLLVGKLQMQPLPVADPGAARRAWTRVIDAPDAAPDLKAEALALRSAVQREEEKQLADLNRAVELQPEKTEYLRMRAQYLLAKEKFDEALADAERALKLDPEEANNHELRGMILLGLEKYDEALASFNRATELVPQDALPYQHRGQLYRARGELEKALEQLTKAIELSPDNAMARIVRATVYYELKETDKALEDLEHAIRIQPTLVQPHLMRVEIYAASGRMDEAIAHLERLVQLAPGNAQLLTRLASFYVIAERPRKAIETLKPVIEQESENFEALRLRSDAYLSTGQHAEAIADFERAHAIDDDNEGLLNNFAWVLATSPDDKLRDGERALKLATKAAELSQHQTPHILSTLGAAYAETGDFENAKKWSQKAIELAEKAVETAEDDEERTRLQKDVEQLKNELVSYEKGEPVRERQMIEEAPEKPKAAEQAPSPATPPGASDAADSNQSAP